MAHVFTFLAPVINAHALNALNSRYISQNVLATFKVRKYI